MAKGFKSENKGDGGGKADHYVKTGMTKGMHGKSLGGHPSIRAGEMKGKGEGHHLKQGKMDKGNC